MTLTRNYIEIMAPVGSIESIIAAIQGGANSIYFGVEQLNMRAKSTNNFTLNDLNNIVEISNQHSVKTYLTLNTIMYDHDLLLMKDIANKAKELNVNAIIASDLSVITYAKKIGMEIHISTQQNISNIEAVRFFSKYADVMVLARELNINQVKKITKQITEENIKGPSGNLVKIELFVHGALCMAISGKCYLSLHESYSSANRGACIQTCRKAYIATEKESGNELEIDHEYIMSPKDLCTIGFIDKIIEAGVSVFKIEGRARSPEYVKTVTQCYREAVDSYFNKNYSIEKIKTWENELSKVFNRGFWDGYYLGRKMGEWSKVYGSKASKKKTYIGKITNYFSNLGVIEIKIEAENLKKGDEIIIIGPTTGVIESIIKEIRYDLKNVEFANKGDLISVPIDQKVRRSDKIFRMTDIDDKS